MIDKSFITLSQSFPNFSDLYTIFKYLRKPRDNQFNYFIFFSLNQLTFLKLIMQSNNIHKICV